MAGGLAIRINGRVYSGAVLAEQIWGHFLHSEKATAGPLQLLQEAKN